MSENPIESIFSLDTEHDETSPLLASSAPPTICTNSLKSYSNHNSSSGIYQKQSPIIRKETIPNVLQHTATTTTTASILTQDLGSAYSFSHDHSNYTSSTPRQSCNFAITTVSNRANAPNGGLPLTSPSPHTSRNKRAHSIHAISQTDLLPQHRSTGGSNSANASVGSLSMVDLNQQQSQHLQELDNNITVGPQVLSPGKYYTPPSEFPENRNQPRYSVPNILPSPMQTASYHLDFNNSISHLTYNQGHAPDSIINHPPQFHSQPLEAPVIPQEENSEQSTGNQNDDDDEWVDMSMNELDFAAIEQHIMQAGLQHHRAVPMATGLPKVRPSSFKRGAYMNNNDNQLRKIYSQSKDERFVFYSEKAGVLKANTFEALDFAKFDQPIAEILRNSTFWLDITEPSQNELNTICKLFNIHPLTEEDIESDEIREKCEVFKNYYFIVFRTFEQHEVAFLKPIQMFIVVFQECVLSFHHRPVPHTFDVLKRIEQLRPYGMAISPDWISYAIIDDVTDSFQPLLRYTELEVDTIDDLVLILKESEQSDMLQRIGHARKNVNQLLRLLATKPDVLKTIIKRRGERMAPGSDTLLYLGDIQDHILTMLQNIFHYETTLSRSHSNYLASITIELTQASNKTNDVVMRMTALASVLIPLNVITGLWGMNVLVPGQGQDTYYWFFGIVACMSAIAGTSFWLVRRHNVI